MDLNSSQEFFLIGFTDLGEYRKYLSVPFAIIFLFTLLANGVIMLVIVKEQQLHSPMHALIGFIAALGFLQPIFLVPRMLVSFAWERNMIYKSECLVQMFCLHMAGCFQSTILLAMALDRFFAVVFPLRYHHFVNVKTLVAFGGTFFVRNLLYVVGMVALVGPLRFCRSGVIYHCVCEHTSVVNLACGDLSRNYVAGVVGFSLVVVDCVFIVLSYAVVFAVILRSPSGESRRKAVYTCGTHLAVLTVALLSCVGAFVGYRVPTIPRDARVMCTLSYLLLPNAFNPVIYGLSTTQIRRQIAKHCGFNQVGAK